MTDKKTQIIEAGMHFFATIHGVIEDHIDRQVFIDIAVPYFCEISAAHLKAAISYAQGQGMEGDALKDLINRSFEIYWNGIQRV